MRHNLASRLRVWRRRKDFPIRLPHTEAQGVLALCDGTRSLRAVADRANVSGRDLLRLHDEGRIVLWREQVRAVPAGMVEHVILSPHPDDAALGLGGMMLSARPGSVRVVTVFGRSSWCRFDAPPTGVEELRRAEEVLMARLAGARLEMLDLAEAMLRGYAFEEVFGVVRRDEDVRATIEARVAGLVMEHAKAQWYLPLGVGGHVDHVLARDAAAAALARAGVAAERVLFYEDLPYAMERADRPAEVGGRALAAVDVAIGPVLRWKLELLRVYASQFTWSRIRAIGDYARRIGGGRAVERCMKSVEIGAGSS